MAPMAANPSLACSCYQPTMMTDLVKISIEYQSQKNRKYEVEIFP